MDSNIERSVVGAIADIILDATNLNLPNTVELLQEVQLMAMLESCQLRVIPESHVIDR